MATRKTGTSPRPSSTIPAAVSAAELPATRAMLGAVRTELLERIDQTKVELRTEIQETKAELRAEIQDVKVELGARLGRVEAGLHEVKAEVARVAFLVEEQNARNKVVLDALVSFIDRQDRLEERMDGVEETVRSLAAPVAPPAG